MKITHIASCALVAISCTAFANESLSATEARDLALQTQKYLPLAEKRYKEVIDTRSLDDATLLLKDSRDLMEKWVNGVGDETLKYIGCRHALSDLLNMIQYTIDGKRTDAEMAVFKDNARTFYENMEGCDRVIDYYGEKEKAQH